MDTETKVAEEFRRMGFMTHTRDVVAVADILTSHGLEESEACIEAACAGYAAAKGFKGA